MTTLDEALYGKVGTAVGDRISGQMNPTVPQNFFFERTPLNQDIWALLLALMALSDTHGVVSFSNPSAAALWLSDTHEEVKQRLLLTGLVEDRGGSLLLRAGIVGIGGQTAP